MASILQHQVESKVNDLYFKMQRHAQIIMKLSVELDKLKGDNEELKSVVNQDRMVIKKLYRMLNNRTDSDIKTRNNDNETGHNNEHTNDNDNDNDNDSIINDYNNYNDSDRLVQKTN